MFQLRMSVSIICLRPRGLCIPRFPLLTQLGL